VSGKNQISVDGKRYGYWEYYYSHSDILRCKGNFVDDKRDGYWVDYRHNGKIWRIGNYINGKLYGYGEIHDYEGNTAIIEYDI
jgi:antitoxin component YwqK of YwqJK toxin-antitoxin module